MVYRVRYTQDTSMSSLLLKNCVALKASQKNNMFTVLILISCCVDVYSLSELFGVPQPYSLFVDSLIPYPSFPGDNFLTIIQFFLWLTEEDQHSERCAYLDDIDEFTHSAKEAISNYASERNKQITECNDDYKQGTQCIGRNIMDWDFTSWSKTECADACEIYGADCCEWYQRSDGNKFCDVYIESSQVPATEVSKENIDGSYSTLCNRKYDDFEYVISDSVGVTFGNNVTIGYVGVGESCPTGMCAVMSMQGRIYYTLIENMRWFLQIRMLQKSLIIRPYVYIGAGLQNVIGVNISSSSQYKATIINDTICGYFDIFALYDTTSYDDYCEASQHILDEVFYVLRICNDTSIYMQRYRKNANRTDVDAVFHNGLKSDKVFACVALLLFALFMWVM